MIRWHSESAVIKLRGRMLCLWVSRCYHVSSRPAVLFDSSSSVPCVEACQCLVSLRSLGPGGCVGLHCPPMVLCGMELLVSRNVCDRDDPNARLFLKVVIISFYFSFLRMPLHKSNSEDGSGEFHQTQKYIDNGFKFKSKRSLFFLSLSLCLTLQENGMAKRRTNLSGKTLGNPRKGSCARAQKVVFYRYSSSFFPFFSFLSLSLSFPPRSCSPHQSNRPDHPFF